MDANKASEIMAMYNAGLLSKAEAALILIIEAGCDAEAVEAVFAIYSKKEEDKPK